MEYRRHKVMRIYFTDSVKLSEKKLYNKRFAITLKSFLTEIPVEFIV